MKSEGRRGAVKKLAFKPSVGQKASTYAITSPRLLLLPSKRGGVLLRETSPCKCAQAGEPLPPRKRQLWNVLVGPVYFSPMGNDSLHLKELVRRRLSGGEPFSRENRGPWDGPYLGV